VSSPATRRPTGRRTAWPLEVERLWTCEIDCKVGYRKSTFRAMAQPPGGGKRRAIGESAPLRWTLVSDPEPPMREFMALARSLVTALRAAGWERVGTGEHWYSLRFVWRGEGEPEPVTVPDPAEAGEPPSR
jgi:hypothetical protein